MSLRYSDYRTLTARFPSTATCGHSVNKGDIIGFARRCPETATQCPECWAKWQAENAAADHDERFYRGQY